MERLTDKKVAENLKSNIIEGLKKAGVDISIDDLRYIKLAEYENEEERKKQTEKHGRWSECYTDTHHYSGICSVCGKASIKSLTESLYKYCPKCGADMRE